MGTRTLEANPDANPHMNKRSLQAHQTARYLLYQRGFFFSHSLLSVCSTNQPPMYCAFHAVCAGISSDQVPFIQLPVSQPCQKSGNHEYAGGEQALRITYYPRSNNRMTQLSHFSIIVDYYSAALSLHSRDSLRLQVRPAGSKSAVPV